MVNRHDRRKPTAKRRKELKTATLDQHFEETLRRIRTEFERAGQLYPGFECLTDRESFHVPANWPNPSARAAACLALKDCFRRRGVNRYIFTSEGWVGKTPGPLPADDPDRDESVQVLAVERNGARRYASAEITRNGQSTTLGAWQVNSEIPLSWLAELLEDGYSDRSPKPEPPVLGRIRADWLHQHPEQAADFQDSFEIYSELGDLIEYELQKHGGGGPLDMFMALESVVRGIVTDLGSPAGIISEFARFLRDCPDQFSMFAEVPEQVPSPQYVRRYKAALGGHDRNGRACCGMRRSTSRVLSRLPPLFGARVGSTSVRRDLPAASDDTVRTSVERRNVDRVHDLRIVVGSIDIRRKKDPGIRPELRSPRRRSSNVNGLCGRNSAGF
jgi:hypothetical protein